MEKITSKYKGVTYHRPSQQSKSFAGGFWRACKTHKGKRYQKTFKTEREAALGYDKMCLSFGLEPVNILVKK